MFIVLLGKNTSGGSSGISVGTISLPHINDLPHDTSLICKTFADDTSLFSKVKDSSLSLPDLNYDLETINQWAHQWKIPFNPDLISKQQKCYFIVK